jgi:hypothetical protein
MKQLKNLLAYLNFQYFLAIDTAFVRYWPAQAILMKKFQQHFLLGMVWSFYLYIVPLGAFICLIVLGAVYGFEFFCASFAMIGLVLVVYFLFIFEWINDTLGNLKKSLEKDGQQPS